ncbi:hypothetical protein GGR52DRAFT_588652 [Hypoxylon sp. FL1284]|nr:hypothetical protein GGR52DRAFT_588652 [Hypoxylon sp. FL1284]
MSAPYWGQLPPSRARRMSGEQDQPDRRPSLDQPDSQSQPQPQPQPPSQAQSQLQSRSNRASVQTALTDSHTESTFSPLESPAASNFPATSLAPRPPTLPYGQNQYPPEQQERRRRRASKAQEEVPDEITAASPPPPPAAPDVPKAPPVSYKDPYRNGSPAYSPVYSYNANGQPGPPISAYRFGSPRFGSPGFGSPRFGSPGFGSPRFPSPQARLAAMEADSYYKGATPPAEKQARAPVLDRSRHNFDENGEQLDTGVEKSESKQQPANGDPPEKATIDPASPKRQGTFSAPVKRPTWADDRSPLQKLELTLDSITKEEKRARVEAAERRIREKAARKQNAANQDKLQPPLERTGSQKAQARGRRQSVSQHEEPRLIVADPVQAQPSGAVLEGPLTQNAPEEPKQYATPDQSPISRIPVAKTRNTAATEKADLPQRNLSFRERASKNDVDILGEVDDDGLPLSPVSPVTPPAAGFALTRNGSNKLKKNPPGDPWYAARREAEEKSAAYQHRNMQAPQTKEPSSRAIAQPADGKARGIPTPPEYIDDRPPARGKQVADDEGYEDAPSQRKKLAAAFGFDPTGSLENSQQLPPPKPAFQSSLRNTDAPRAPGTTTVKSVKFPDRKHEAQEFYDDDYDSEDSRDFGIHDYMHRGKLRPGRGMYQPPEYLDEWKNATVGTLGGMLLDLNQEPVDGADKSTPWWENSGRRRSSTTTRPEAFDGAYEETRGPTRFRPPLYLQCGPLLRYCGIRHEKPNPRISRNSSVSDRQVWRGSVMVVTKDAESSYDVPPILRLFVQPIELLPPPPAELQGELPPEYVDPIAGIPKLGRRGETLYVRPVEHLEEGKDVSRLEPDDGLFEITRSAPDFDNAPDPPNSFTSRKRRTQIDGEKIGKYKDVRGFRLHAERGQTFWRFNIEVELRDQQQRIAYRINHGPATGFWVPARDQSMNIMFHSCNGFSLSVNPDDFSGPDPMWRDVLNNHQTRPFHVMIGGGDQIYNDAVMRDTHLFQNWLQIKNPLHKNNAPFTPDMQDELEQFYLDRYSMWFSQGLFGLANCQIPMVNMYDDHDIIDGFGSYPDHFMKSPVFSGLGNVAFKYYMLFQHQSLPDETEQSEPSWALGTRPGPYIQELSRSLFVSLGNKIALLAVDCRTERTRDTVVWKDTWKKLMDRCEDEMDESGAEHLLVLLGVPIAYPRLVWLENILTSRLMDPIKALGKTGMLGNFLNRFDGGVEVLDDLDDHWTAKNHKDERWFVIQDLQDFAASLSVRVTVLSGDVHLAAVGQFYANPKLKRAKHKDFRYIPNIISSAIANTPPPDLMADILNKRNKIHHYDKDTDEDMIPMFLHGVDGKPRNNKHLLPRRNWCSIREYTPGQTPPPTPPPEEYEITPEGTPPGSRGGFFRRLSLSSNRGPTIRPDASRDAVDRSRPPLSGGGGLFRSFSRRASSDGGSRSNKLLRTLSLGRRNSSSSRPRGSSFSFGGGRRSNNDGGINGNWGAESEEDEGQYNDEEEYTPPPPPNPREQQRASAAHRRPSVFAPAPPDYGPGNGTSPHLRGGGTNDEYEVGDDSFFTARPPRRAFTQPAATSSSSARYNDNNNYDAYYSSAGDDDEQQQQQPPAVAPTRPFHRTPTGLSAKQRRTGDLDVNLEGGLDVCLNVEVNPKDPAGITVPYRLLVPRLWYEYSPEDAIPLPDHPMADGGAADAAEEPPEYEYDDDYVHGQDEYGRGPGPEEDDPYVYEQSQGPPAEKPAGGGLLKRLFSGRGRGGRGGGDGSQYRARRQSP